MTTLTLPEATQVVFDDIGYVPTKGQLPIVIYQGRFILVTGGQQGGKSVLGAKKFQETWAFQYHEMAKHGSVPTIEKPEDPQDPGNVAKGRILLKLNEVLEENKKNGIDYVPSLWEILSRYPSVFKTAGANTPVTGRGRAGGGETQMPYAKLHNTSIEAMVSDQAPQS